MRGDRRRHLLTLALGATVMLPSLVRAAGDVVQKERAEVPQAESVTAAGVRYEAPPWTRVLGLPQNGGYVFAFDALSGAELWRVKLYGLQGSPELETDKREVFIVEMRVDAAARRLRAVDDRGRCWLLDLKTRRVTRERDRPSKR
jgi:hypothetical protein